MQLLHLIFFCNLSKLIQESFHVTVTGRWDEETKWRWTSEDTDVNLLGHKKLRRWKSSSRLFWSGVPVRRSLCLKLYSWRTLQDEMKWWGLKRSRDLLTWRIWIDCFWVDELHRCKPSPSRSMKASRCQSNIPHMTSVARETSLMNQPKPTNSWLQVIKLVAMTTNFQFSRFRTSSNRAIVEWEFVFTDDWASFPRPVIRH